MLCRRRSLSRSMTDRRGSRFVLEVLFLVGLAVALTLAKLSPLVIAGAMLLGWLIVAILEWAAWRGEPHYGSGLPPRYYVPNVSLPPAQPLEQVSVGYPETRRDEEATWIASPAVRAEVLGEWPHAAPAAKPVTPVPAETVQPVPDPDPWTVVSLPGVPEPEPEPAPERQPEPAREAAPEPAVALAPGPARPGVARYTLDPLADPAPRRRFGRGGVREPVTVEVPARPEGARSLPGQASRQE